MYLVLYFYVLEDFPRTPARTHAGTLSRTYACKLTPTNLHIQEIAFFFNQCCLVASLAILECKLKQHCFKIFSTIVKYLSLQYLDPNLFQHQKPKNTGVVRLSYLANNFCLEFHERIKTVDKWNSRIVSVFNQSLPVHIVVYEELVKDPMKEIRAITNFLEKENGFKQDDSERRLLCLNQNLRGSQKRKTPSNLTNLQVYTKEMKQTINGAIKNAQQYLLAKNISINISSYLLT